MHRGYWVITFRSISNPDGFEAYNGSATPVIAALGGRVLVAGLPSVTYESGMSQRVAVVEFDSLQAAHAAYNHPDYQAAVRFLTGAAERDVRIVEGR